MERAALVWILSGFAISGLGAVERVEAIDRFDRVPVMFTQSPEVFEAVFGRARCQPVRGLIFGDSQETTPGGLGVEYTPRLNYELWRVYGNAPTTPLFTVFSVSGGSSPWADWLVSTGSTTQGMGPSTVAPNQLPPGISAASTCVQNGNNINNNQWHGQLGTINFNGARTSPAAAIPTNAEYFRLGTECYIDVYAATSPVSGEVSVRVKPTLDGRNDFYAPVIATLQSSMGLEDPMPRIVKQRLGPLPSGGQPYMQVELGGTRADRMTQIIAAEFVGAVDRRGMTLTTLSAGGYRVNSIFENHANCGPFLGAFDPDFVILTYGANDSGQRTAVQYKTDLQNLIAFIRSGTRADLPVILIADPFRVGLTAAQSAELDRYPGACLEIAMEDPLVCALNSRRILHGHGWNEQGCAAFLSDTVHLSPAGAILKARVEIEALTGAFAGASRCAADMNADCAVLLEDLLEYLEAYDAGETVADLDDGSRSGTPDQGLGVEDLLYYLQRYELGC